MNNESNEGNLPLHLALSPNKHGMMHPCSTVLAVLAAFPKAAEHAQGCGDRLLALHIAANNGVSLEVFDAILNRRLKMHHHRNQYNHLRHHVCPQHLDRDHLLKIYPIGTFCTPVHPRC